MQNLTRANQELFKRTPDQCFETMDDLFKHCDMERNASMDRWHLPGTVRPTKMAGTFSLELGGSDGTFGLIDWSFGQLCKLSGVGKETVNRVSAETAGQIFSETLPRTTKPWQLLTQGSRIRSIHGASYTRLHNAELLEVVSEVATDFTPPQRGMNGGTGLYCGEQDMFVFLIDPGGWTEIDGQAFAPGFFLWNSEVGRRSVGVQTFWFQAVCQNHIVWDAVEIAEFSRKHTANVRDSLSEVRRIISALVEKRDERRDGFMRVMEKAVTQKLGEDAEEVLKILAREGIGRGLAKQAVELAREEGCFTIFSLVDALTRLTPQVHPWIGDRTEADERVSRLLALAA
jgi:hypothetical protein